MSRGRPFEVAELPRRRRPGTLRGAFGALALGVGACAAVLALIGALHGR